MAGDWIKMRTNLRGDPAVKGIAKRTGLSRFEVIGRLHAVWSWADQNVPGNGNAPTVTAADIDEEAEHTGFAQAMADEHWLKILSTGVTFPDFDRHNGKPAKERALTGKRVKRHRNAQTVTKSLPEKRREVITNTVVDKAQERPEKTIRETPESRPFDTTLPPTGETPMAFYRRSIGKPAKDGNGSDQPTKPGPDHEHHGKLDDLPEAEPTGTRTDPLQDLPT